MFALIEAKGAQFKVKPGDKVIVPYLNEKEGKEVEFRALLLQDEENQVKVGTPFIEDTKVKARILRNFKGPKMLVLKFKRRKRYNVLRGHRQMFTEVEIEDLGTKGGE